MGMNLKLGINAYDISIYSVIVLLTLLLLCQHTSESQHGYNSKRDIVSLCYLTGTIMIFL